MNTTISVSPSELLMRMQYDIREFAELCKSSNTLHQLVKNEVEGFKNSFITYIYDFAFRCRNVNLLLNKEELNKYKIQIKKDNHFLILESIKTVVKNFNILLHSSNTTETFDANITDRVNTLINFFKMDKILYSYINHYNNINANRQFSIRNNNNSLNKFLPPNFLIDENNLKITTTTSSNSNNNNIHHVNTLNQLLPPNFLINGNDLNITTTTSSNPANNNINNINNNQSSNKRSLNSPSNAPQIINPKPPVIEISDSNSDDLSFNSNSEFSESKRSSKRVRTASPQNTENANFNLVSNEDLKFVSGVLNG